MLKKLQEWLFKEDYEELEIDDDNERIESLNDVLLPKEAPNQQEEIKKEDIHPVVAPTKQTYPKINIDIKADEPIKETVKSKKNVSVKTRKTLTKKEEYEIPPVISPFFGIKGEESDTRSEVKTVKTTSKESFNAVISPYYGNSKNKNEKEKKDILEKKENLVSAAAEIEENYDEDNISLDEIVSSTSENNDDMIQFSLFGENKRIQEDEFKNENAEEETTELPF